MKIKDWMIAALNSRKRPVLYWDGAQWTIAAEMGKSYYDEAEARKVMQRLQVPADAVSVALEPGESSVES